MADQGAEGVLSPFLRSQRLKVVRFYLMEYKEKILDVDWIHTAGAKIGLFSRYANEECEDLLDRIRIEGLANQFNLKLLVYLRFLFGANQLAVFWKNGDPA